MKSCSKNFSCFILFFAFALSVLSIPLVAQQERWDGLNQQLAELYRNGRYEEGIPVAQQALRVAESTFGPTHFSVATSLNNLAEMYRLLGRFDEARPLYERALRMAETEVGPDNP